MLLLGLIVLLGMGLFLFLNGVEAGAAMPEEGPGYGANVAAWDIERLQGMGFDWVKVFNPPSQRLPLNVLVRVEANADDLAELNQFRERIQQLARTHGPFVEAYEIGNETNLDAVYGWGAVPVAADYVTLLCAAYGAIRQEDPDAIVVSAGLAPVGRVQGEWEGHAGHNGAYQDEREYLREFLQAGGGDCADAIGYHPYGFSADYDAAPDVPSADPRQNCANGFCFRGVEKIYEMMAAGGWEQMEVWPTEFGWIVEPPAVCLEHPSFQGREWQLVTEQQQAENLVGAFTYATENWPWIGPLFVFNLNFNQSGLYEECEQMRYYAIQGRPAEAALRDMPEVPAPPVLTVSPPAIDVWGVADEQPFTRTSRLRLHNGGGHTLYFTATTGGFSLTPVLTGSVGSLAPGSATYLTLTLPVQGRSPGVYTGTVTIAGGADTEGAPAVIPVSLTVLERVERLFLPVAVHPDAR